MSKNGQSLWGWLVVFISCLLMITMSIFMTIVNIPFFKILGWGSTLYFGYFTILNIIVFFKILHQEIIKCGNSEIKLLKVTWNKMFWITLRYQDIKRMGIYKVVSKTVLEVEIKNDAEVVIPTMKDNVLEVDLFCIDKKVHRKLKQIKKEIKQTNN